MFFFSPDFLLFSRAFLRALLFVKSGQFINTARVDPALLVVESSRLRIRDKKSLAVCVMTGTLTESFIIDSSEAGPRSAPYAIHKVTVAPLEQEWRRDVSVWGMLFNFRTIVGSLSENGFAFATRVMVGRIVCLSLVCSFITLINFYSISTFVSC